MVSKINFLKKDHLQDPYEMIKIADFVAERARKAITKATSKVEIIMEKMMAYIKDIDLDNYEHIKESMTSDERRCRFFS